MLGHVPAGTAAVIPGAYMELPRAYLNDAHANSPLLITALDGGGCAELQDLARRCRGDVYVSAEELDRPDLLLDEVDQLYRLVGLRRYRRVWLASPRAGEAVAAVLAYRGPLGMNFSFLENRCDLLVSPDCPADDVTDVVAALLTKASHTYDGLPLSHLMVACNGATENVVRRIGGHVVQPYTQSICLQAGLPAWFSYIDSLYARRGVSDVAH